MDPMRYILIGGFLGAGKTTAILHLAEYLSARGQRVGVIANDQGADLADTARLRAAGLIVEEITGGCFCCQFDALAEASQRLAQRSRLDVLIAEPVGSCTDLKATVGYPLRQSHAEQYRLAPLSVMVDPRRCAPILGVGEGKVFSDKVIYVYRKQLEEAEFIVVNKTDLLDAPAAARLNAALLAQFPQARVLAVSCKSGAGITEWFDLLVGGSLGTAPAMTVDYDAYAAGEALLGWVNVRASLHAPAPFDGNALLLDLAKRWHRELNSAGLEVAHMKLVLVPGEGPDIGAVSLARNQDQPEATHSLVGSVGEGRLVVNLRAEADPQILKEIVAESLHELAPVTARIEHVEAFRPGRPKPTHRVAVPRL
jgi:Ni2+-binding GTPase involved in maturation of urease and hydrogenase